MEILIKESQYRLLLEQSNIVSAYNDIVDASSGFGTNPDKILRALDKIKNIDNFNALLDMFSDKKTGYNSFSEMINQEYERDNYNDILKLKQKLYPLGITVLFKTGQNNLGMDLFMGDLTFRVAYTTEQINIGNKNCANKYTPLLVQAKKYWVDWLSSPITKQKFIKNWSDEDYDMNDVNKIFKNYMSSLKNLKLFFYNNSIDKINGVNVTGTRNAYAFVIGNSPNNIYINCSLNDENALDTLVHEIQHILYHLHPLNSDRKIGDLFVDKTTKKMGPLDFLNKVFKIDNTDNNLSQKIKNASKNYSVEFNTLKNIYLDASDYEKRNPGYACSMNEKMSNITAIRKLFNIKPGQNITLEMLKPYIKGDKSHTDIGWLLSCWALKNFPDINTLINKMNLLAYQDVKKQDNSRLA
jgi:hypothetical protein